MICKKNCYKDRVRKMRNVLMKEKLLDAEKDVTKCKVELNRRYNDYHTLVIRNSFVDLEFRNLLKSENNRVWQSGLGDNKRKMEHLKKKNQDKQPEVGGGIRNIVYRERDLVELENTTSGTGGNEPRIYGGAVIGDNATTLLKKDPNFMILKGIDETEVEVEIEKGMAKARYEFMSGDPTEEHTASNKTLNYANLRATDIPTVQRIYPPAPGTIKQEKILENLKENLLNTVKDYKKLHCDGEGRFKETNLSKEETRGLKEIKAKVKRKEIVVFSTDKSGRFSIDTPENYVEAVKPHTANDEEIESEKVKKIETKVNQHMRQFNKMFQVGSAHGHEDRVTAATLSTNTPPPPIYGLRKDHKTTVDKEKGPPVRPVCGAKESPNSRLSNFLSRIVNDYADSVNIETECRSSEQMKAEFEEYNKLERSIKKECCIVSMDVKALYPSMEWNEIEKSVREMVENSERDIENVNWIEVGKYLAVIMSEEEIEREGLRRVIPERRGETNRKITVAYLADKKNEDKWMQARAPGSRQKKKMLGIAISRGVRTCMENHVYCMGDKIFLQKAGGPIGLELTGAVSRAFMARWDRLYLEKVRKAGGDMKLFERYVDDSNQIGVAPPVGAKYDPGVGKIVTRYEEGDESIPSDERLARVLLDIANSIMPCVQMEADWPSKNEDRRMPILDMKVWMGKEGDVIYSHYEKPVSSKTVLHSRSAHPTSCKRSVHTQEILRRLLNCSKKLDWESDTAPVVGEYMRRMRKAGYTERYREGVLRQALAIHDTKWKDHHEGKRPIFRRKDYNREDQKRAKESKRHNWAKKGGYLAPIFVPATPGSKLLKMMKERAKETEKEGIRFNLIEAGGTTIRREIQKSNPTATPGCSKVDCWCCKEERGGGGPCHKSNVNYVVKCKLCPAEREAMYVGETARNLYTRMGEHANSKGEGSFMMKHMADQHEGMERKFQAKVVKTNTDCLTRQVREGVLIANYGTKYKLLNTKSEWHQPSLYKIQCETIK